MTTQRAPMLANRVCFLVLALAGLALDLATKWWVFAWRGLPRADNEWWIWEGYVGIETALNRGALFGMGEGQTRLFCGVAIVAALAIAYWVLRGAAGADRWLSIALGCVTAGILGNLYDRLGLWSNADVHPDWRHAVRDWILFRYGQYTWPNFNIADSLLVCGTLAMAVHAYWQPSDKPAPGNASAGA